MRDHEVGRDEWGPRSASQPLDAHISHGSGTRYGITYPNARCPVCHEKVFFFAAHNGGRVFFDPPLGPPWYKHGCTIQLSSAIAPLLAEDRASVDQTSASSFDVEIYARRTGTVLVLSNDSETLTFSSKIDLTQRYLDRAWLVKNERGSVKALSLLTVDFEPIELPVRARRPITPMDARTRRELSFLTTPSLARLAGRIHRTPMDEIQIFRSEFGAFAATQSGPSCLILIPVVVDHPVYPDHKDVDAIWKYMNSAAVAASCIVNEKTQFRSQTMHKDQIIFLFDDPLGRVEAELAPQLGFDNSRNLDKYSLHYRFNNDIDNLSANYRWDTFEQKDKLAVISSTLSIEESFDKEYIFCDQLSGKIAGGRWKNIMMIINFIGIEEIFDEVHSEFLAGGLIVNHIGYNYSKFKNELEYVFRGAEPFDESIRRVRVLFSMSSESDGIAVAAGWTEDEQPLTEVIAFLRDAEDVDRLVSRLKEK